MILPLCSVLVRHNWSAGSSSGLPSTKRTWTYWRESSQGSGRWLRVGTSHEQFSIMKQHSWISNSFSLGSCVFFSGKWVAGSANLLSVQKDSHSISANTSQSTRECTSHPGKRPHHMMSSHSHLTSSQFLSSSVVILTMLRLLSIAAGSFVNVHRWNQDNSQIKVIILACLQNQADVSALVTCMWCFEVLLWNRVVSGTF